MANTDPIITLSGLKIFKDNYDIEIDEKIAGAGLGKTYTLSKNDDGEIVLTDSDGATTSVTDENTTYSFSQDGTVLTITPSDGEPIEITLGGEITKEAIEEALGFSPNLYINDSENEDIETESPVLYENDIVDSLSSTASNKPLSANQGYILNEKIDNVKIDISSEDGNAIIQKDDGIFASDECKVSMQFGNIIELKSDGIYASNAASNTHLDIVTLCENETVLSDSYTNYDMLIIHYKNSLGFKLTMNVLCDDIVADDTYQLLSAGSNNIEIGTIQFNSDIAFTVSNADVYKISGIRSAGLGEVISLANSIIN